MKTGLAKILSVEKILIFVLCVIFFNLIYVNAKILWINRLQKQLVTQNQDLLGKEFFEGKESYSIFQRYEKMKSISKEAIIRLESKSDASESEIKARKAAIAAKKRKQAMDQVKYLLWELNLFFFPVFDFFNLMYVNAKIL